MTLRVVRLSEPAVEPISQAEARMHLRVDLTEENAKIAACISGARARCEDFCNRPFALATFALVHSGALPGSRDAVCLPFGGIVTIDAASYIDAEGARQAIDTSGWDLDDVARRVAPDADWPSGTDLRIDVTAGSEVVPPAVREAMLLYVGDLFELRRAHVIGVSYMGNPAAQAMLMPYRERMGV